ncbi:MAG: cysteine desulfurase family protein [Acidobacteriota bacterium]
MRRIYLDHNATAPPRPAALAALEAMARRDWANPASPHQEGRRARELLEGARQRVAQALDVSPAAILFTSGGTEAAHAAIRGAAHVRAPGGAGRIVISGLEHPCVRAAVQALETRGFHAVLVPPTPQGVIDADRFLRACGPDTAVAALMAAHNEFGTLQPVDRVAEVLGQREVPLVVDAVQAIGRVHPALPRGSHVLGLVSAHKVGGLAGAGAVVVDPDRSLEPVLGGGEQERGRRGGTPPLALLVAMGAAVEQAGGEAEECRSLARLRDAFEAALLDGADGVSIIGKDQARLPNTSAFLVDGVLGEDLVAAMDLGGIAVSTGSACSTGSSRPSASLLAMGLDPSRARGLVRVSLGPGNNELDVETAAGVALESIKRLRRYAGITAGERT